MDWGISGWIRLAIYRAFLVISIMIYVTFILTIVRLW